MRQLLLTLLGYSTAVTGVLFGALLQARWPLETTAGKWRFAGVTGILVGLIAVGGALV